MISGVSKAATLYLAPVLALTSLILVLFAYTAPSIILHSRVALLVVSPSLQLTNSSTSQAVDGPTVFLGALGNSHSLTICIDRILIVLRQGLVPARTTRD